MGEIIILNEKYLKDYYEKRKQFNILKNELDEMSDNIKATLQNNKNPLGCRYGNYAASLSVKYRLNSNFIQMLKCNNMNNRVVEVCYIKDCKDIVSEFTSKDREKYFEEWYKQLVVKKI